MGRSERESERERESMYVCMYVWDISCVNVKEQPPTPTRIESGLRPQLQPIIKDKGTMARHRDPEPPSPHPLSPLTYAKTRQLRHAACHLMQNKKEILRQRIFALGTHEPVVEGAARQVLHNKCPR